MSDRRAGPGSDDIEELFRRSVVEDITSWTAYFHKQLRHHRRARITVIVAAGAVPVLTPVAVVDRVWLGVLGALAAGVESLVQLYRWRDSGIAAMRSTNAVDHLNNLYVTASPPYDDDETAFRRFVDDVEKVRQGICCVREDLDRGQAPRGHTAGLQRLIERRDRHGSSCSVAVVLPGLGGLPGSRDRRSRGAVELHAPSRCRSLP